MKKEIEYWKSLAAARLADQVAIEKHTEQRVAREIAKFIQITGRVIIGKEHGM